MMEPEKNVEWFHREMESRKDLEEVELSLNGHRHHVLLPSGDNLSEEDELYLMQRASSLRWIEGPGELSSNGHVAAQGYLENACQTGGDLDFESELFSSLVVPPAPDDVLVGDGVCSLFIDIGGSSLKGVLFSNEQLSRQLSMAWEPFLFPKMSELLAKLTDFLTSLLCERSVTAVSHVGISCAGLCRGGALLASTLTQGMIFSDEITYDPWFLKKLVHSQYPSASFQLLNDGEVTALPHRDQAPFGKRCVISLVMGSNLGGGYYSPEKTEAVHELGYIPFLLGSGLIDEWSGYEGIASEVFSKRGLLRIAAEHGYVVAGDMSERDLIDQLHTDLRHGLVRARTVFQKLGKHLAPFVAYLQRYYQIDEVLLSGGILTAAVVDEMRDSYETVYQQSLKESAPPLRMLVVPGVLPEYNQVWSLALNHFATTT